MRRRLKTTPCCPTCNQPLPKSQVPVNCLFCGAAVKQNLGGPLKQFCGRTCYYRYHQGQKVEAIVRTIECGYCGLECSANMLGGQAKKYCSAACCNRSFRLRKSEAK